MPQTLVSQQRGDLGVTGHRPQARASAAQRARGAQPRIGRVGVVDDLVGERVEPRWQVRGGGVRHTY